jgi:hypothetical protein
MSENKPVTTSGSTPDDLQYQLVLVKGDHRWQFCWAAGDEADLINAVSGLARDRAVQFDWFDAAMVCHHAAQQVCKADAA